MDQKQMVEGTQPTERLPFEQPKLISNKSWTLENITANIGGFYSDSYYDGNHDRVRRAKAIR